MNIGLYRINNRNDYREQMNHCHLTAYLTKTKKISCEQFVILNGTNKYII